MIKEPRISASIMCMDPYYFKETFATLEESSKIDFMHIDVMDGHYVPNFGIGTDFIKKLRKHVTIPFDYHLMVIEPTLFLPLLGISSEDIVSVHYECTCQIQRTLEEIKKYTDKVFLAINPGTPICVLDELLDMIHGVNLLMVNPGFAGQKMVPYCIQKLQKLVKYLEKNHAEHLDIQVDGNITFQVATMLRNYGANIFVAGTSSIFNGNDLSSSIQQLATSIGKNRCS